jgi:hypothetical protein
MYFKQITANIINYKLELDYPSALKHYIAVIYSCSIMVSKIKSRGQLGVTAVIPESQLLGCPKSPAII